MVEAGNKTSFLLYSLRIASSCYKTAKARSFVASICSSYIAAFVGSYKCLYYAFVLNALSVLYLELSWLDIKVRDMDFWSIISNRIVGNIFPIADSRIFSQ